MSITSHFAILGAPLKNSRWSWGAMRQDGTAVLRVWQHEFSKVEVLVQKGATTSSSGATGLGYMERTTQLRSAAGFYCVVCVHHTGGKDGRIASWDKREVWFGSALRTDEQGNVWLKLLHRVAVGELLV